MKLLGWTVRENEDPKKTVFFYGDTDDEDGDHEVEVVFLWDDVMCSNERWSLFREIMFRTEAIIVPPKVSEEEK